MQHLAVDGHFFIGIFLHWDFSTGSACFNFSERHIGAKRRLGANCIKSCTASWQTFYNL